MSLQLARRRFTVEEYRKMAETGILGESDRVELIEGEVVEMPPISSRHAAPVRRLIRLFSQRVGERAILGVQDPVELSDRSEPLPDIALLPPRADFSESGHPQPEEIFLLVEVADTTVESDRKIKVPLYASTNIAEVWLVDIDEQAVEVYREPAPNDYQNLQKFQRGQNLSPQALPDIQITVDEILG